MHIDPNSFVDFGAKYNNREYEFSTGVVGAHNETLHRGSASLTYGLFLDQDTLIEAEFEPGVWSDFSNSTLHHEDWQFFGNARMTWRYSKELFLKAGVEYSPLFRDIDVYATLGLAWLIDSAACFLAAAVLSPKRLPRQHQPRSLQLRPRVEVRLVEMMWAVARQPGGIRSP